MRNILVPSPLRCCRPRRPEAVSAPEAGQALASGWVVAAKGAGAGIRAPPMVPVFVKLAAPTNRVKSGAFVGIGYPLQRFSR